MKLDLDYNNKHGYVFSTNATMRGDTCPIEARTFNEAGLTQAKDNKILFGGS